MSLAQGNNTPTRPRIEPGSPDPESDSLTTRPVRPQNFITEIKKTLAGVRNCATKFKFYLVSRSTGINFCTYQRKQ